MTPIVRQDVIFSVLQIILCSNGTYIFVPKEKLVNELGEEVVGYSSSRENKKKKKMKKNRTKGNTKEKAS